MIFIREKSINMPQDLISIIAPCYNVDKYLDDFLISVKKQTYTNLQIVLVDDGSDDKTPLILDKFKEENTNVIVIHQANRGVSAARNTALKYVKGKYVFMADPDDILHFDAISYMYKLISENEADCVVGQRKKFKEYKHFSDFKFPSLTNSEKIYFKGKDNITAQFLSGNMFVLPPWAKLYKTEILKKIDNFPKVFDEDCFFLEDIPFGVKYFSLTNKVIAINNVVYYFRKRKGSATHSASFSTKQMSAYKGWGIYKKLSPTEFKETQTYIKIRNFCDDFYLLFLSKGFKNKEIIDKRAIYKRYKQNLKYIFKGKRISLENRLIMLISLPFAFLFSVL